MTAGSPKVSRPPWRLPHPRSPRRSAEFAPAAAAGGNRALALSSEMLALWRRRGAATRRRKHGSGSGSGRSGGGLSWVVRAPRVVGAVGGGPGQSPGPPLPCVRLRPGGEGDGEANGRSFWGWLADVSQAQADQWNVVKHAFLGVDVDTHFSVR